MAQQYFPSWLSPRCFLVALLATAVLTYQAADRTGFSTEGIVVWIVESVAGGVLWGVACTWAIKKFGRKQ
jgi:hypothetical protein